MSSSSRMFEQRTPSSAVVDAAGSPVLQEPGDPAASPFPERSPRRGRWKLWLAVAALWAGIGLLFATQDYVVLADTPRAARWIDLAAHKLVVWLLWGAMSPLIISFARAFPINGAHAVRNLLLHILAGIFFPLLNIFLFILIGGPLGVDRGEHLPVFDHLLLAFRNSFAITFAIYAVTVIVVHALEFYRAYRRRELIASQLEARLAEARLDVLRMQLQPHFLFNTLHGISALMEKDVAAARKMITRLSSLLRLSLENDAMQEISLANELEFLEQYVEIQRMRFQDRLSVELDIEPRTRSLRVPRLLLQPLVENSIRHGLARHARAGRITISAAEENGKLRMVVRDNGPGLGDGPVKEGVGIGNTRARLEHLYGNEQSFTMEDIPGEGLIVTIIIPARQATGQEIETR